jgi:hypothetical protein
MANYRHTAAQRAATGLDAGARSLILGVVLETAGLSHQQVIVALFRDRYGTVDDYYSAVGEVHGHGVVFQLQRAAGEAAADAEFPSDFTRRIDPNEAAARALLTRMPEADFRLAIEEALRITLRMEQAADRITSICRQRGAPWIFDGAQGFAWVGDATIERDLVKPALAAINDPRFAGGVRSEFESARAELRQGTPQSRKQAVHEAGCSVESAMKVLLDERAISYSPRDTAQRLFDHLVNGGVVPNRMERLVLAAATPRNQTAGHGAGAVAHNPDPAESESVVASAAGAIAYLHSLLP